MRIFLFLFIIFLWINFNVCGQTVSQVKMSQNLFREAQNHLENNETELFKKKVIRAADLRPKHPSLMLNCAYAFCLMNEFDSAIKKLREIADMGVNIDLTRIKEFDRLSGNNGYKGLEAKFKKNLNPMGQADLAFELTDPDLLVEGVTFDRQTGSFFLSSIHKQKIIEVSADGKTLSETDLSLSPMGIKDDPENRLLWVSLVGTDQGNRVPKEKLGQTGIAKFDIETKQIVEEYIFQKDSVDHLFGDLLQDKNKYIYLSDSKGGSIYRIDTDLSEIQNVTTKGKLISPQGMAFSLDRSTLIIADYSLGLVKVNPETGEVHTLDNQTGTTLLGIDGLYRYKDALIAVQNGIRPNRILKLTLAPDESAVTEYEILLANHPAIDDPTLGVISGDRFYVNANSQWYKFSEDFDPESMGERTNPKVLSVSLE